MNKKSTLQSNGTSTNCHICERELDYLTASVSQDLDDSIYMCFGALLQKIFVYGKFIGGKYGAIAFSKYYTRGECKEKLCEDNIYGMLESLNDSEYSRFITCNKGMMNCIILTKNIIDLRMKVLAEGTLSDILHEYDGKKKYYCRKHAEENSFQCSCGEELIDINSEKYRQLMGMPDHNFIEMFMPEILSINPYEDTRREDCQ
ncbi:hypothetical protein ACFL20_08065 [Spirochaetota bacterium]